MNKNILEITLDKVYTLQFSIGFVKIMAEKFGIDLTDGGAALQDRISTPLKLATFTEGLIYSGIANHSRQNGLSTPITQDELAVRLEGLNPTESAELATKVLAWLFTCLEIPVEISQATEGEAKEGERFHLGKDENVRPRRTRAKAK